MQVTWYRDSVKLFETDRLLMTVKHNTWSLKLQKLSVASFGNLFINNLNYIGMYLAGNYSCLAVNSLGSSQQFIAVTGQ